MAVRWRLGGGHQNVVKMQCLCMAVRWRFDGGSMAVQWRMHGGLVAVAWRFGGGHQNVVKIRCSGMAVHGGTVAVVTVRPRWDSFLKNTRWVGFFRK